MYSISFNFNNKVFWVLFIIDHDAKEYDSEIKNLLEKYYRPEQIIIVLPSKVYDISQLALHRIGKADTYKLSKYFLDKAGNFIDVDNSAKNISLKLLKKIREDLFREIFYKHESVLKASEHSYFILPNNKVSTAFVRVGNSFKCSVEVGALSIFLLPYLKENPANIYCDSPSIFPLIYSTILLKNIISGEIYNPTIKSFNTYGVAIDDIENYGSIIFIISTTVSGSLPEKISNLGHNWKDILILYNFSQKEKPNYRILKDFSKDEEISPEIKEYDLATFKNKYPQRKFEIAFDSDQFLPTSPKVSLMKLIREDAPQWLSPFIQKYYCIAEFITCYRGVNSREHTRDLYFDIKKVLTSLTKNNPNNFESKTYKLLVNNLPINLKGIIYVDEEESIYIAELVQSYYKEEFKIDIPLIPSQEIDFEAKSINDHSSFLVCVSCVSEGKKITNVSRLLRKLENSQITYFCGIIRVKNNRAFNDLRSNLKYGKYGFNTYNLISIEDIYLPNEDSQTLSWEQEKLFLEELLSIEGIIDSKFLDDSSRNFFEQRLNELRQGKLVDNVFLKNTKDEVMLLNKNFAFFDFYNWNPQDIRQTVVYFSILSVFHNHRLRNSIVQNVFERHLLDPGNFNRFNDGIIQAALLRTAQADELKYSIHDKASQSVTELIINIIKNEKQEDSAPLEFLLSLCTGKMTLKKDHYKRLYESVINDEIDPRIEVLLKVIKVRFINDQLENT